MGGGDVFDVDVVSGAGSIFCWVVGSEYCECFAGFD